MDDAVAGTSARGRIALVGCVLALLGLVLVTLLQARAGVGSSAHWLLALVTPFVLQLTVACGVLALALLLLREWELLVVTLVLLAYNGQRIRTALTPRLEPDAEHAHRADEEPIRLLLANVNTANRGWDRVLALVEEEAPDVIALLEVSDAWLEGLAPLPQTHRLRAAARSPCWPPSALHATASRHPPHRATRRPPLCSARRPSRLRSRGAPAFRSESPSRRSPQPRPHQQ